jgi:hypothetical protein
VEPVEPDFWSTRTRARTLNHRTSLRDDSSSTR